MALNTRQLAGRRNITLEQVELLRKFRGLTHEGIEALPESALRRSLRRLDYPDAPRARTQYRLQQYRDEQGQTGAQPLVKALRELDSFRLRSRSGEVAGIPIGGPVNPGHLGIAPTAGLAAPKWRALGPGNIGGRTRAILIHPTNHTMMWVGSAGGGIWRSVDAGQTWAPVDDLMANLALTSLVADPSDANVIYAGTGEG